MFHNNSSSADTAEPCLVVVRAILVDYSELLVIGPACGYYTYLFTPACPERAQAQLGNGLSGDQVSCLLEGVLRTLDD